MAVKERRRFLLSLTVLGVATGLEALTHSEAQALPPEWPVEGIDVIYYPKPGESINMEWVKVVEVPRGHTVLYYTGDVSATDLNGESFDFPGGVTNGKSRGSIILIRGPIGKSQGGKDVYINIRPKYISIWGIKNPVNEVNLNSFRQARVINTALDSFRRMPSGVNGLIDVAIIDGLTGLIEVTETYRPGQKATETGFRTYIAFTAKDKQ